MNLEEKYDRSEPNTKVSADDIHSALKDYLNGKNIESAILLSGGYLNTNYKLTFDDNSELLFRISNRSGDALKTEIAILNNLSSEIPSPRVLSENWRKESMFLDLLPQLQFLARDANTPKTFSTAKTIIEKTIDNWGNI